MIKQISILTLSALAITACGTKAKKGKNELSTEDGQTSINLSYMDKSVKASEDFFQFADGSWVKNNPVPASESRWGSFNELDKQNKVKIKEIIKVAVESNSPKGADKQLIGDYYTSFVNMKDRDKAGLGRVQLLFQEISRLEDTKTIPSLLAKLHNKGISAFFSFGVGQDLKNVDKNIIYLSQTRLGLPNKNYYFESDKSEIKGKYKDFVQEMFMMSKIPDADEMGGSAMMVEESLAKNMMEPKELRIPENTYHPYPFDEANAMVKRFNLDEYAKARGFGEVTGNIIVSQPKYMMNFTMMLETFKLDQIKAYLNWCVLNHYAGHLSEPFVLKNFEFYGRILKGSSEMKSIEDRAIDEITNQTISEVLGKEFVAKHFSEAAKERVNKMVDNLLLVFEERINNLEWMSDETKKEAQNKLASIGRKLGYPEEWKDFSKLTITSNDYLANIDACAEFSIQENIDKLDKPVDKKEWGMPAHMINAYYHPLLNEIAFPAGIMQPPFFDMNAEDAVNYGTIGMVIGHEFTHGFDDMGSKFAADGSFTNWWTTDDRTAFEERTKKLGNTFEQFCALEGHCVNPDLTMGENIADLGGITLAYHAYSRTEEFKNGEIVAGFTPAQRFFIAYAQLWKINYTDAELKNRLENDPHSPGMYRVNGPLMNCPEFFQAFDVKEGDPMRNSADKISNIW